MAVPIFNRDEEPIRSLEDWKKGASTKGKWEDEYSAKELARLWLAGKGAAPVEALLSSVLPGLTIRRAVAEAQIPFDRYRGGVRNHDVLAFASAEVGPVVIGVEGKVNEPLDSTMKGKYRAAAKRRAENKNTNQDKRVDELFMATAGRAAADEPALLDLRYQLFSAVAGTYAIIVIATLAGALGTFLQKRGREIESERH